MVEIKDMDLLKSDAIIIAHQTNCKGVMGSGVALQIKDTYPIVFERYSELCKIYKNNTGRLLGSMQDIFINSSRIVINLFGQDEFKHDGNLHTNYYALDTALRNTVTYMRKNGIYSIAFPYKMSCDRGGGDWKTVFEIIDKYFGYDDNIKCTICKLPK